MLHWQLFERDVEHAFCNPCNPQVLRLQLPCAARELPLKGICVKLVAKYYDVCKVVIVENLQSMLADTWTSFRTLSQDDVVAS